MIYFYCKIVYSGKTFETFSDKKMIGFCIIGVKLFKLNAWVRLS